MRLPFIRYKWFDQMRRERNELAREASSASSAMSCIASEMRILLSTDGIRLPVIEQHLDAYYAREGRPWRH